MFCKNCRTQLNDGAAFCHNCGTAVTMPNAEAVQTENVAENTEAKVMFDAPTASSTENVAPIYQMPQYTAPVEEPQSDKKGFCISCSGNLQLSPLLLREFYIVYSCSYFRNHRYKII